MPILCVNCVNYVRVYGKCNAFSLRDPLTGEITALAARDCRLSESMCGEPAIKFVEDTVENVEGWK